MKSLFFAMLVLLTACTASPPPNDFPIINLNEGHTAKVFTTADSTNFRLALTDTIIFVPAIQPLETGMSVFVNPNVQHQAFLGIGGAITDASAEIFAQLSQQTQDELLKAYYDSEQGIGYTLLRTTIHSSDFGSGSFTYVTEGDTNLSTFSIDRNKQYRIPMIKRAIAAAGGELLTYASPWSPPAYMKDNNNMLRGGKLLPQFRQTWADYYVKFIKAYEAEGIPLWGITIQNEPMAVQRWESCIFSAEEERDFLKLYLGPTLHKNGLANKKIVVWDHNRDLMVHRANTIFSDPDAAKYAWGIGYHWYETWAKGDELHQNIAEVVKAYPNKQVLFTEGCVEKFDAAKYQHWPNAERYGRAMINDFNAGTVGWTDWNILLDQNGGPNHVNNFCFAPVHADTNTGQLIFTPTFYYLGHFSKFIKPGARRISTAVSHSHLLATSFVSANNQIVTVVMNGSSSSIQYQLYVNNVMASITILPHSMQTVVY